MAIAYLGIFMNKKCMVNITELLEIIFECCYRVNLRYISESIYMSSITVTFDWDERGNFRFSNFANEPIKSMGASSSVHIFMLSLLLIH